MTFSYGKSHWPSREASDLQKDHFPGKDEEPIWLTT